MKKFDLFGIGNALVDTEIEVGSDFLQAQKIEPGLMTLIDKERFSELSVQSKQLKVHQATCGGSAANTIITASQLGLSCYYNCKVSRDEWGQFYMADLRANHVSTESTPVATDETTGLPTGQCFVFITPDAERSMLSHLGVTETLCPEDVDFVSLRKSRILYVEGYLMTSETGRLAARAAFEDARKLSPSERPLCSLTFSDPGVVAHFKEQFQDFLRVGRLDLLFCNEAEAFAFTGEKDLSKVRSRLLEISSEVAVTLGAKGAIYWNETGEELFFPSPVVQALDTNGAGDAFAGGFLFGKGKGYSSQRCLEIGVKVASHLVTEFGARLNPSQLQKLKEKENF